MGAWEDGFAAGYRHALRSSSPAVRETVKAVRASSRKARKPKRKLTAHNRFMRKEMKALRRKHPRMKQPQIMKKANVAWRKHKRSKR